MFTARRLGIIRQKKKKQRKARNKMTDEDSEGRQKGRRRNSFSVNEGSDTNRNDTSSSLWDEIISFRSNDFFFLLFPCLAASDVTTCLNGSSGHH